MIVTKFGGSSLASADRIKKACEIQLADPRRRIMVVSAPGKRFEKDIKVTDLLIKLAAAAYARKDFSSELGEVLARFSELTSGLNLAEHVLKSVQEDLNCRIQRTHLPQPKYLDLFKAAGEDNCAKIITEYLVSKGVDAVYLNPKDAGMILSDEPGNGYILPSSYAALKSLSGLKGIGVFPGFFGYDTAGEVVTFGRGGSDITGSVLAKATGAELYENFTDVDNVFAVNPSLVKNPVAIGEITYREMRELAYAGFTVLHQESLEPLLQAQIPIHIKNSDNPNAAGTLISCKRDGSRFPVAGIAAADDFCVLTVGKYLMNREIGFGRRLFQILEQEHLSFDHAPSGIDTMSPIFKQSQMTREKRDRLLSRIKDELDADFTQLAENIAIIMLVGEGLFSLEGTIMRAASALFANGINIEVLNMSCGNKLSIVIGVKAGCMQAAVQALYLEFFEKDG